MKLKVHKLRVNNLNSANRYSFIITVQQSNRTFLLSLDFHGVLFSRETSREENLVAAAGVLQLARVEAGAAAEEVVNLTRLDVIWEPRHEERVDSVPVLVVVLLWWWWLVVVEVVRIVGLEMSHFDGRDWKQGGFAGA